MASKTQPFGTRNDTPQNFTLSPDTSYLRDNIAVPVKTLNRTAAIVSTQAASRLSDSIPTNLSLDAANPLVPADALE